MGKSVVSKLILLYFPQHLMEIWPQTGLGIDSYTLFLEFSKRSSLSLHLKLQFFWWFLPLCFIQWIHVNVTTVNNCQSCFYRFSPFNLWQDLFEGCNITEDILEICLNTRKRGGVVLLIVTAAEKWHREESVVQDPLQVSDMNW